MTDQPSSFEKFQQRYIEGVVPWDDPLPPPEILELVVQVKPGRALDLGCGFGRTAIYLAQHGWVVDGIDFVPQAIEVAKERALTANLGERTAFYVASATDLSFLQMPYDLVIDIGCMHSFTTEMLLAYGRELSRLLVPNGLYVLFAHLRDENEVAAGDEPRWIHEAEIFRLMESDFVLERLERGTTQVADNPPWESAWFWFRRQGLSVKPDGQAL